MLILRAIPFSFAILWRYLLVLPLLLAALFLFALVAVIFAILFGLFAPFLGVVFALAFGLAAGIIPVLVGLRVGLQGQQVRPRNSYLGLMKPAIGYGFLEGFCGSLLLALCFASFLLATPLTTNDLLAMRGAADLVILDSLFQASPALTITCFTIGGTIIIALRAALLVPLAGASVGVDPDGRPHTPFYGFGSGFASNFVLVLLSYIGPAVVFPLLGFLLGALGLVDRLTAVVIALEDVTAFSDLMAVGFDGLIMLLVLLLVFLWFFSLQCAGAVLVFAGRAEDMRKARGEWQEAIAEAQEKPMAQTDMRELMRSRMPQTRN